MAHPRGRTSFRHDDYKVQREFERVGQQLTAMQSTQVVSKASGSSTVAQPIAQPKDELMSGFITIDILPTQINDGDEINIDEKYKYEYRNYHPGNGYYGWAVYRTLYHGKGLKNKNDFLYSLVDVQTLNDNDDDYTTVDENDLTFVLANSRYPTQKFSAEVYGLNQDTIIFRGVAKPDNVYGPYYNGNYIEPTLDGMWKDQANNIIISNLVFHYTIKFKR